MERRFVIGALPLGPLLTVVGYLVLLLSQTRISDAMLLALICFPTGLLLLAALLAALLRRDATHWVSLAIGTAVGTAVTAVVVGGAISLIAWMLSRDVLGVGPRICWLNDVRRSVSVMLASISGQGARPGVTPA